MKIGIKVQYYIDVSIRDTLIPTVQTKIAIKITMQILLTRTRKRRVKINPNKRKA